MISKRPFKERLKRFMSSETVVVSKNEIKDTAFVHYLETY